MCAYLWGLRIASGKTGVREQSREFKSQKDKSEGKARASSNDKAQRTDKGQMTKLKCQTKLKIQRTIGPPHSNSLPPGEREL